MTESMTLRARVSAPLKSVRHALTDAAELRVWLAEFAEVDLPGRFEFWGRHTPEGDAPRQRVLHADDSALRFVWPLDGVDTTVEISVADEGPDSTIVSLTQSHYDREEQMSGSSIRGVMQTFWCLSLANLVDHLEGRALNVKADFTSAVMRDEALIDAPREQVYQSLIDSEKVSAWFGFPIGIEPWVGGRYSMGGFESGHAAKVVDLEPGSRVAVDWGGPGVTTWELADSDGKTRLTMVQSGFDEQNPPYDGWLGNVSGLAELRRYHDLADWQPIWVQTA
ncbi:SRPBCC family protein [Nonomuraea endophytica]|uniref:SRPBCC family protein n=1 Tax=Nonomuraea endophytica TaxID=714136 RepID=UPI0037C8B8D1